jgi:hypothetical protein
MLIRAITKGTFTGFLELLRRKPLIFCGQPSQQYPME